MGRRESEMKQRVKVGPPNASPKALCWLLEVSQRLGSEFSWRQGREGNIISRVNHGALKVK